MVKSYKINKGYNLDLEGCPKESIESIETDKILLHPSSINGIKTKLLLKENDDVKIGTPLFFDKKNPDVMFVSPGSGKIKKITYGERRSIDSIEIELDGSHSHEDTYNSISIETLSKTGLLSFVRQRPFSKVANPNKMPRSIFISAMPTAPYAINYSFLYNIDHEKKYNGYRVMDNFYTNLNKGVEVLKKITNCDINIISEKSNESIFKINNVNHYHFNTLHPAGNVGIQIHKIDPIKDANDIIWYLSLQDLERIGSYFLKNLYPSYKYISVGGNCLENPRYVKALIGTPIDKILENENLNDNDRIISGDILSGSTTLLENSLNYFDDIVSVIHQNYNRDFLGWMGPGFDKFTLSGTFASSFVEFIKPKIDTKINGSVRSIIPMGNWDKVLPMDILSEFLIKSILCKDIDMMEKLGIYECDPEDFALCSLACQSKVEVSKIVKEGLDLIELEG